MLEFKGYVFELFDGATLSVDVLYILLKKLVLLVREMAVWRVKLFGQWRQVIKKLHKMLRNRLYSRCCDSEEFYFIYIWGKS